MNKIIIIITLLFTCLSAGIPEDKKSILGYFEDNSYWLNMPNEFYQDSNAAKKIGAIFVLIPNGFNFNNAPAIIYSSAFKNKTIDNAIKEDIIKFKQATPSIKISKTKYFNLKTKKSIAIKEFINPNSKQQPYETIAYIQEGKHIITIVVSAFQETNYNYILPKFIEMTKSYESSKIKVIK